MVARSSEPGANISGLAREIGSAHRNCSAGGLRCLKGEVERAGKDEGVLLWEALGSPFPNH
ncbi:hypothetical protein [Mesorhizobium sp. M1169]|uniref:hypothetical protein n=1 Tax=Mesorhizobium sp. M1169 TaxID=2957066 RepID=UPI0033377ED6